MNSAILSGIVVAYFAVLLGIAFYTSRHSDNESFFIGNRNSKWWLVAFGMIGTSLSGMTFISVPGTVGKSGFDYFQVTIGYWLGYFVVAYVLLPLYYRMQVTSIYTYLEKRMGMTAYKTGALFFILSRTLGATLRLYLVIKVLEKFVLEDMGISFATTAVIILLLILLYTFRGGVKTIVWTDTLQTSFMLLALIICIFYVINNLGLTTGTAWHALQEKGLTRMIATDPLPANFFLKQVLGGAFITITMTGLDQEMMQKNISVSNLKDAQKNMLTFGFVQMVVVFIFLMLGGVLSLYAAANGLTVAGDDLFPTIAVNSGLPFYITVCFLIGLISALFPSADGALTALTSSYCIDIIGFNRKQEWDEKKKLQVRRTVHIVFALVFLAFVFFFREVDNGSLIDILLKVAGFTYGPLLALFTYGLFTRKQIRGALVPVICILSPILTFLLDILSNAKGYAAKWKLTEEAAAPLLRWSGNIFHGYVIGTELLVINAGIAFLMLWLFSTKKMQANKDSMLATSATIPAGGIN